ncbi:hypothetical protein [Wolbachia endosymbiont (group A) of Agelastica alni]|uniref:hypothetical protein n=1 Tax=Wolbachia endosymbiont (group A) of Agelastica alni TaxID=3066130 RepID=UPI003132BEFD
MKNIFNKTNAPYLVASALATLALVSSGVVGVLTAVAVFNASLPLIAGLVSLAVFSAATIAFSAIRISKNNIISQKEAEAQFYKDKLSTQELTSLDYLDPAVPSKKQEQQADKKVDYLDLATSKNLNHLNVDISSLKEQSAKDEIYEDAVEEQVTKVSNLEEQLAEDEIYEDAVEEQVTKVSSPESQPAKGENGQGWGAWGKAKVAATVTTGIGLCGAVLYCAASYIPTVLNGVVASSMDNSMSVNNGTCPSQ